MIGFLRGTLMRVDHQAVTLLVQDVGYELVVPSSWHLSTSLNQTIDVHTHLLIRDDAHQLFGFRTLEEREGFRLLLKASGVGPKLALSMLGQADVHTLIASIRMQDRSLLSSMKGVGPKLVDKILLDLKNKVNHWSAPTPEANRANTNQQRLTDQDEAIQGLLALGYKTQQARSLVAQVAQQHPEASSREWLRLALQGLGV